MPSPSPSPPRTPDRTDENAPFLSQSQPPTPNSTPESTRRRLLITLVLILLAIETGGQMIPGPMVRIMLGITCDKYWAVHDPTKIPENGTSHVPEQLCNVPEVQAEVATVKGYSNLLEGLLSTLSAITYGHIADAHGRRFSIRLTIPGFLLNGLITNSILYFPSLFPLRSIWAASLSWVIGGGPTVAMALIWTMLADLSGDSERAATFFRVGLVSQVGGFVAAAGSSALMGIDPWVPLLIGCGMVMLGLGGAWGLPETINLVKREEREERERAGLEYASLRKIRRFIRPYLFIFTPRLLILVLSFLFSQLALSSSSFLTQYISTRFSWTLAKAQLLASLHSLSTIPVFAFLIPHLTKQTLRDLPSQTKDLYIARFSILSLAVGCLGLGLSPVMFLFVPSLCIHALGTGFALALRSLVTSMVKREETARLYAVVEVMGSVGSVLGSLLATNVFKAGMNLRDGWVGLVYVTSGILFMGVGGAMGVVSV